MGMKAPRGDARQNHPVPAAYTAPASVRRRPIRSLVLLLLVVMVATVTAGNGVRSARVAQAETTCPALDTFSFNDVLHGPASSLSIWVQSTVPATGAVVINGADTRQPTTPFLFTWGDGSVSHAFFPATHTYSDPAQNYRVEVTAYYPGGATGNASTVVWFQAVSVSPVPFDPLLQVSVPSVLPVMSTRLYPVPPGLVAFGDSDFTNLSRGTLEHILTVGTQLQYSYAGGDVLDVEGGFNQVVLRDPNGSGGMYSLWFTNPVAFAIVGPVPNLLAQLSSLFHEMGHNISLNSPAGFQYGGQVDGNANAIYSETMAQIFQHVTILEMVRDGATFGLGCDLRSQLAESGSASLRVVRNAFNQYLLAGMPYSSWNNPGTLPDETFGTFMTLAYTFFDHLDESGMDGGAALQRMMDLLQTFGPADLAAYAPGSDSPEASRFRSTLMVAALSHGLQEDLRQEFENLNFPIDDEAYERLTGLMCVSLAVDLQPSGSGSVSVSPPPNCAGGTYLTGTEVTVTATPAPTYAFAHWSGAATGSANPLTVTLDSAKAITANFSQVCYSLEVHVLPESSGSVGVSPGPNCPDDPEQYIEGTLVTLTAAPAPTFAFSNWSGSGSGSTDHLGVTMNSNKSVTANFSRICYTLAVTVAPPNSGSIGVSPSSNCPGGKYISGTVVTLTANPAVDWFFLKWGGEGTSGTANPVSVIASANKTATAYFAPNGDDTDHPLLMAGDELSFELDATNANTSIGEPVIVSSPTCSFSSALEHTIWLKFIATHAGTMQVSTDGSDYNAVAVAFAGAPASANQVDCVENASAVLAFDTLPGMTYWIEFGSWLPNDTGRLHVNADWFASTDVNCTHLTDATDALVLLRILAGLDASGADCPADVDRNGFTDLADALIIRRRVAGLLQ